MHFGPLEDYGEAPEDDELDISRTYGIPESLLTSFADPSSSSSSPSLKTLLSVNQRYRSKETKHNYIYPSYDSSGNDAQLEELRWTRNRLVWLKAGKEHLRFTYSEGQDVVTACFAHFDIHTAAPNWTTAADPSVASTSAHTLDDDGDDLQATRCNTASMFGPFQKRQQKSWTHDALTQPRNPTPDAANGTENTTTTVERYLLVFLHDIAWAYPSGGDRIPFRLPFRVKAVWPMDRGVMIERAREGLEILDGLSASKPTLYSLLDPLSPIVPIASCTTIENVFADDDEDDKKPLGRLAPVQDLDSRIVMVSPARDKSERILVMANERTNTVSIWAYARLPPQPLDLLEQDDGGVNGHESIVPDRKGKGRASTTSNTSVSMAMSRSTSGRRKRSSIASQIDKSFNRRTSNMGIPGPSSSVLQSTQAQQDEEDILTMLGDKSFAAVRDREHEHRRTSLGGRHEASMAIDRMALGTGAPNMDRTMSQDEDLAKTVQVAMTKIWESDWPQTDASLGGLKRLSAYVFDARTVRKKSCLLAIHDPSSLTLDIYCLVRTSNSTLSVSTATRALHPARTCCPVFASRPDVLDLLYIDKDGKLRLISCDGIERQVDFQSCADVATLDSDCSRQFLLTLADGSRRSICKIEPIVDELAKRLAAVVAHVFNTDDMLITLVLHAASGDKTFASIAQSVIRVCRTAQRRKTNTDNATCVQLYRALHLLAEECKLCPKWHEDYHRVAELILLCLSAGGDDGYVDDRNWYEHYSRAIGFSKPLANDMQDLAVMQKEDPFDTMAHLSSLLHASSKQPTIDKIIEKHLGPPSGFYELNQPYTTLVHVCKVFEKLKPTSLSKGTPAKRCAQVVEYLFSLGWTHETIANLSFGVALPIREALRLSQGDPPATWPPGAYELVRRPDLARQVEIPKPPSRLAQLLALSDDNTTSEDKPSPPVMQPLPKVSRFSEDRRIDEVWRMLQFFDPVTVGGGDRTLDQLTPQVQQSILNALSNRTFALPIGFAMFTYNSTRKTNKDAISIPAVNTSARILPLPSAVSIVDKEPRDGAAPPPDRSEWPEFHAGVSAALRLRFDDSTIESSEIHFNRPSELDARHGGLLLGLGLQGQLASITYDQVFEYLAMKHQPTSVGLLLGLATSFLGTADPTVMSVLAVHIAALHPRGSQELLLSGMTTSAAVVGVGLLHIGTRKRSLADTLIRELIATRVTEIEDPAACREAYALSAGFAIGMIMLGAGRSQVQDEVELLRTMRTLISGSGDRPLPGVPSRSEMTDVNITSPAATVALGLMYLKSHRKDVAAIVELPDTQRMLDYVRPDLLLLRTCTKALIQWDDVRPSKEWIESNVPRFILEHVAASKQSGAVLDNDIDIAKWNIIAGACLGVGIKYAGTAVAEGHGTLIHYLDRLTRAAYAKATTVHGKIKRTAIRACLSVVSIALALIMAGTGEINVLRRLRVAHGHFSEGVTFGTHLASHMSLGMLFLNTGHSTLGTSDLAVASLFLSCFPVFPTTPLDNRAHLQAFRHLWTLAAEPRCLVAKDVETGESVFLPVRLRLLDLATAKAKAPNPPSSLLRSKQLVAPTLIPELRLIESITVDSPRYWSLTIDLRDSSALARFVRDPTIYVKRRTGHLSYAQDPRGLKSIFTRSKSETGSSVYDFGEVTKTLSASVAGLVDFVKGFTKNEEALEYIRKNCHDPESPDAPLDRDGPTDYEAFSAAVLLECLTRDKYDVVPVYHEMRRAFFGMLEADPTGHDDGRHDDGNAGPRVSKALLDIEQLSFAVDLYRRGSFKIVFQRTIPPLASSRSTDGGRATPAQGATAQMLNLPSSFKEPLIQGAFVDHVYRSAFEHVDTAIEPHRADLRRYLRGQVGNPSMFSVPARRAICVWLSINEAPSFDAIAQLRALIEAEARRAFADGDDAMQADDQDDGGREREGCKTSCKMRMFETSFVVDRNGGKAWTRTFGDELVEAVFEQL